MKFYSQLRKGIPLSSRAGAQACSQLLPLAKSKHLAGLQILDAQHVLSITSAVESESEQGIVVAHLLSVDGVIPEPLREFILVEQHLLGKCY
jgi:hypothetical protein